jgi:Carboxypeptidase regulatory-like domain/TonB dependent receptor
MPSLKENPVNIRTRRWLLALSSPCLVGLFFAAPPALRAQQAAGAITGTVTDPSGAAIAGATVTAKDVSQGTTWTASTTSAGLYDFPAISAGTIELKVEAQGFATQVRSAFTLTLNQLARVDFQLKVGQQNQTVTVTGAAPILQTDSSELGTVLNANTVDNLPLASRDLNQLTLLTPGVVSPNVFSFEAPVSAFGTGRPYVDGAREQDDTFWLDGMDMNQPDNSDVSYTPAPDAVAQFDLITSNAPADYGNYIGGTIVDSIKSGTNQFHGDLYEYVRNTDLNANSWQDKGYAYFQVQNPSGTGYVNDTAFPRPPLHWNNFGGTLGGPIIKDRLFFFVDEESTRYSVPKTEESNNVVPAAFIAGNFASLCTSAGGAFNGSGVCSVASGQLYDPYSGNYGSRTPIPNNNLAAYVAGATDGIALSKAANNIVTSTLFQNSIEQANYFTTSAINSYQGDVKIDWQATRNDHVIGRWTQMHTMYTASNGIDNALNPAAEREYPLKNFVLNYDHTFTPTLLNEFRVGFQDFPANDQEYSNTSGQNLPAVYGIPGVNDTLLPSISYGEFGSIGSADLLESFHDTNLEFEDSLTWTHGRHSIHGGFEFFNYRMNDVYPGNAGLAGSWAFTGQFTGNSVSGTSGGDGFADFLLGLPENVQEGSPFTLHLRNSIYGGFVQDNYRATSNLTLNLGLRYEDITPRNDAVTDANINFDLVSGTPEIGKNYNNYLGIANLQPRFGFAWQPSFAPQTVVRGGYGISTYMEGVGVNNMADMNPPNTVAHEVTYGAVNLPSFTFDQGYGTFPADGCTASGLQSLSAACISGATIHETNPNMRPAVDQQWNLTVQRQFGRSVTASLGYVGNKIDHMTDIYWYGQSVLQPGGTISPPPFSAALFAAGAGAVRYNASDGISNYNALEATMATRDFRGLDFQASYTWSKCMTDSLGYFGSYGDEEGIGESQTVGQHNFFQNEYDPMGDYGKCTTDAAGDFNAYGVYALPFGRGKQLATGVSRPVDELIGGWQTSLDLTLRSGFAIDPAGPDDSGTTSVNPRPDCVSGASVYSSPQWEQIGNSFGRVTLNPDIATAPAQGTFGNCQNGVWRGPNLKTADLNVAKKFPVTERTNVEFQAQFINLTNTPIFSLPAAWPGTFSDCVTCNGVRTTGPQGGGGGTIGTFGMQDGSNPGREIELSLKFNY